MQPSNIIGLRLLKVALVAGLHLLPLWRGPAVPQTGLAFVIPKITTPATPDNAPFVHEGLIDPSMRTPSVHAASICELPGGKLGAIWYGGTREGHRDVALYFSTRTLENANPWSAPRAIVTRESAENELQRYVRKIGNAVIFSDKECLWLVYVSVAVGGWSGSSLNVKRSFNEGRDWTPSRRLTLSPFFNISELVKNKPVALADGSWALPIYHETMEKFSELLWLRKNADGISATKSRITGGSNAFQPSMVPLTAHEALTLFRPADGSGEIKLSRTTDSGSHWSAPQAAALPNPDSGLDALRLSDGRLLLAFNDTKKGRANLRLAISNDNGNSWVRAATVIEEPGGEFSYPSLLQTSDGKVHLAYTWQRKGIKHFEFSVAWLNARLAEAKP